jgi:ribonuclease HI
MTREVVKGSTIANHLVDNTIEDYEPLDFDFPDEDIMSIEEEEEEEEEEKTKRWTMFFNGAVNVYGNGIGTVIISPDKNQYPVSVKLHFKCTNNTTEYATCILGLEVALELKIKKIDVYGDLMLIIYQIKEEWQTKEEKLGPYQEYLSTLVKEFEEIEFTYLEREGNHFANALAIMAVMATIDLGHKVQPIHIDIRNYSAHYYSVEEEIDGNPLYYDIKNFVQNQEYPEIKHCL